MKSNYKNAAFVFNCHYNGASIIQELGLHGIQVFALDSIRSVGTVSRHAKFWRSPDPAEDEKGFINFLLDKGRNFVSPPVLFPTNDHWASAIAKYKTLLRQYYIPCVADWPVVELLIRKDKFYSWALERDYPVPNQYSMEDLMGTENDIFPLISKPKFRRLSGQEYGADRVNILKRLDENRMVILKSKSELFDFLALNKDLLPYLTFQDYVPGMADRMYTVGIYADKNYNVLGLFTGRKVRGFPPDIGDCIVGQAEKVPSELLILVKKMVKDLNYHGIAEFEFKKDPRTGKFVLIEINPRSWSWIGITPYCDVSLPWIAYEDLTGVCKMQYKESAIDRGDIKYIKLFDDSINCMYFNKKSGFPEYHMNFIQWWKSLQAKKRIYAELRWDDPIVGLYSLIQFGRRIITIFRQHR
jgi:D-aspartate ligase